MKKIYQLVLFLAVASSASAQITITSGDMPVSGDTLRYSTSLPIGLNSLLNDTGANKTWNLDTLTPIAQGLDAYKTALQVNPVYALTIDPTAFGYKVTDTLGLGGAPLPINVTEVYTFFNRKGTAPNNRYIAEGFAAKISGIPAPAVYSNEDELFFFPLDYGRKDTSDYYLNVNIPSLGRMVQDGDRTTNVDGWGTIKTPFHTTAKNCIRVRTQVTGTDSIILTSLPLPPTGIPRRTADYYWLVQGEHYPALWITTTIMGSTETITTVRYRDSYRGLSVQETVGNTISKLDVYPNPANNQLHVSIPGNKEHFVVEVFDMQGKLVYYANNKKEINISGLAPGNYLLRATFDTGVGYAPFVKQ